jgi:hypothetical protein
MRHLTTSLVRVGAVVTFSLAEPEDASACSCIGPSERLVGPDRVDDAPLGVHVRFEVPLQASRANLAVLRTVGGPKVDASLRTWPDGSLTFAELTPSKPLQPNTRYEIALVDPAMYPSTTVLGTFATGTASDATPPKLLTIGTAVARGNVHAGGGDCSIHGPWIEVGPVQAEDPGRPTARLMFAVWLGDAAGNVDTTKAPTALVAEYKGTLTIGQRSLCDPHDFPIPKTPFATLAIAAVDESGNTSSPRRVRVDLRGVGTHP